MDAAVTRAYELLDAQPAAVRALLPDGCDVIDAHTHLGLDEDGMTLSLADHLATMDGAGVAGAFVFALNEPDRFPAYRTPNDRVLAWAAEAPERLWPFVRLSLDEDPIAEAERCLERGARGIKMHPRAQRFRVNDPRLEDVFALAAERRIPVLIHAGRGLPAGMALELAHVAERHPEASLILAHLAIAEQGRIGRAANGQPNVFFDTSAWSPVDQLHLLSLVAPEQILWASDIPYGAPLAAQRLLLGALGRSEIAIETVRGIFGGTARGLLEGRRPAQLSAPVGPAKIELGYSRARVLVYLSSATPMLWLGQRDPVGFLGLAEAACDDEGDDLAEVGELIRATAALLDHVTADGPPTQANRYLVWRLLSFAQTKAAFD